MLFILFLTLQQKYEKKQKKCCMNEKNIYLCTRKTTTHGEVGEWLKPTVC